MGNGFRRVVAVFIAASASLPLAAAELSVSNLELATTGAVDEGDHFVLASHAAAELSVSGGYKFGGKLKFAFDSNDLEKTLGYSMISPTPPLGDPELDGPAPAATQTEYNNLIDEVADRMGHDASLSFRLASISIREPFSLPIEFGYFIGRSDVFCSGDEFPLRFGTAPIGTAFRGFSYFPEGVGGNDALQYDGIHGVSGTGFSLAWTGSEKVVPLLYAYQDSSMAIAGGTSAELERGRYSADLRVLANGEKVKFEAFAGATFPYGNAGLYRAGMLAYFSSIVGANFLAQVGITRWNPEEAFGINNLFFLFEPRVDFGFTSVFVTFFYHPFYYMQIETGDKGATDLNFRLLIGDLQETSMEGGFETTIGLKVAQEPGTSVTDQISLILAPYFSIVTEGVRWDFKIRVKPLNYAKPLTLAESFIGVRTAF